MSEGFAAVPNWMVRDATISGPAIAVYTALASHAGKGGIFPAQDVLAAEARLGERRTRDALKELEALGVIERVRRSSRGGRSSDAYLLHPNGPDQQPALDAGSGQQPAPGAAATGTSQLDVPLIEEEPLKKKRASEYFVEFWDVYPRKVARAKAEQVFVRLARKVDLAVVVDGARRFASDPNLPEPQFIPHPTSWLNAGRWDDEPLPPREGARRGPVDVEEWMLNR